MKFTETGSYTYNGEQKEYHYSPNATYMEQVAFVNSVTNTIITDSGYMPLLKDVIFNLRLVQMFTDIDMNQFNDDEYKLDLDKFAEFDRATSISEFVRMGINDDILFDLIDSINDNIAYKTGIRRDSITESIIELINVAKDRIATFGEGLTVDDVFDFIDKFKQSGINGEKIVQAYFDNEGIKKDMKVIDKKNADIRNLKQQLDDITAKNVVADKSDKIIPIKGE